jgi:hypothetical protein
VIENPYDLHVIEIALRVAIDAARTPGGNKDAIAIYEATLAKVERLADRWRQVRALSWGRRKRQ